MFCAADVTGCNLWRRRLARKRMESDKKNGSYEIEVIGSYMEVNQPTAEGVNGQMPFCRSCWELKGS